MSKFKDPNFVPPKHGRRAPGYCGRKWYPAAVMVAQGASNRAITETLGIPQTTLSRYRLHEKFREAVNQIHDQCVEEAVGRLSTAMNKSADVIITLLDSESEKIRLEAVDRVERWFKTFRNDKLLMERLQKLEQVQPMIAVPVTAGNVNEA